VAQLPRQHDTSDAPTYEIYCPLLLAKYARGTKSTGIMTTKTTFYGTIFTFNEEGVNDIIHAFCRSYEDNNLIAPFIAYDSKEDVGSYP
jgi:hypothetical protein